MSTENKKEIIIRLKQSDYKIIQTLFNMYYIDLCKVIYPFVKNKFTTEDVAQNVFLKLWEKRSQIEIKTSVPAYLKRMAVNEAITHLRKAKRLSQNEIQAPTFFDQHQASSEDQFIQNELKEQIKVAIDQLPPRCSLIFKMSRYEELSYREIADRLNLSIKTVENQMGKALKILRGKIRRDE